MGWGGCSLSVAIALSAACRCDPTSLPPGPPARRRPLPLSRRRREMSSNKVSPPSFLVPVSAFYLLDEIGSFGPASNPENHQYLFPAKKCLMPRRPCLELCRGR